MKDERMKQMNEYDKTRIAEVANVKSFVIIYCDSEMPCNDAVCDGGHEMEISAHNVDHQHALMLLKQAHKLIMHEGL